MRDQNGGLGGLDKGSSSVLNPGTVEDVLLQIGVSLGAITSLGNFFNPANFWSMAGIYNNASYTPTPYEKTPPAGGYFPALADTELLGDLLIPNGTICVAMNSTATPINISFTGFASLLAKLSAAGISNRSISQTQAGFTITNTELYAPTWGSSQTLNIIDVSTCLATVISGGTAPVAALAVGPSQSPPGGVAKSLILPMLAMYAQTIAGSTSTVAANYFGWNLDNSGNPQIGGEVSLTISNAVGAPNVASQAFTVMNTVNDVISFIQDSASAGGILGTGGFALLSTPFGHVLTWNEIWPVNATFVGVINSTAAFLQSQSFVTSVTFITGIGIQVGRAIAINCTRPWAAVSTDDKSPWEFGVFPPLPFVFVGVDGSIQSIYANSSRTMFWNFARTDRKYCFNRFFLHPSADDPIMPNWASTFGGSSYAWNKYLKTAGYPGYGTMPIDDLSEQIAWLHIQSFYELKPIQKENVLGATSRAMTGFSRMGQFSYFTDYWPLLASWYNGSASLSFAYPSDISATTAGSPIPTLKTNSTATDWYCINHSEILDETALNLSWADFVPFYPSLPCQVEHYNTLASIVNAQPAVKWNPLQNNNGQGVEYTLDFSAANLIIVDGGGGYALGDSVTLPAGTAVVSAVSGGVVTGLSDAMGPYIFTDTIPGTVRPFGTFTSGGGSGLTVDTTTGDSTGLAFIPFYNVNFKGTFQSPNSVGIFWPRTAFYAWNGPSAGGAADPIGVFLNSLGMTVQTSMPDSYGNALPGGLDGFTPEFQTTALSYRWVNISDARTYYASMTLPFILDGVFAPMKYQAGSSSEGFTNDVGGSWLTIPFNQILRSRNVGEPTFYNSAQGTYTPNGINYLNIGNYTALVILAEGLTNLQLAAVCPQNYAYNDPNWPSDNMGILEVLGSSIWPLILDNSQEGNAAETTIIQPTGGPGQYDHIITTSLGNARLVMVTLDAAQQQTPEGVGNSGSDSAGQSGGIGIGNTTGAGGSGGGGL